MMYIEEVLGPKETEGQFLSEAIDPIILVPVVQLNIWGQNNIITGKPIRPTLRSDYIHLADSWLAHSPVSQSPPPSVFLSVHEIMQPVKTSKYVTRTQVRSFSKRKLPMWSKRKFCEHCGEFVSYRTCRRHSELPALESSDEEARKWTLPGKFPPKQWWNSVRTSRGRG